MNLPKELTTVTKTSKTLALIMFTTLPILGFFMGMRYQEMVEQTNKVQIYDKPGAEGRACGGFAGKQGKFACPDGYKCEYPKPIYPDAQGKCVKSGEKDQTVCTMEAKLCPDGKTYVSRQGPKCEFAECSK